MHQTWNARILTVVVDRLRAALGARGWPRILFLRRAIAVLLVLLAGLVATIPHLARGDPNESVVVAAHDLNTDSPLTSSDLALRAMPRTLLPNAVLTSMNSAVGRVLSGPVRAGEPLTDVRLVGTTATMLATGANAAAVPIRLADAGIADLLYPGTRVDVVTTDPDQRDSSLLVGDATVLAVRGGDSGPDQHGPLVLIALPREDATKVAAAALRQRVTVTLR